MRWRLFIEEYSPDLHCIKDTKNVAADALSGLGILNNPMDEKHFIEAPHSELYTFHDEDFPESAFHLSYAFLGKAQSTEVASVRKQIKENPFFPSNPSQEREEQENWFATTMAKLWSIRNYKQESFNGTTITLDIPLSIEAKKPLVNTNGGQKGEIKKHKLSNSLFHFL